jgi:hypothetical protein
LSQLDASDGEFFVDLRAQPVAVGAAGGLTQLLLLFESTLITGSPTA